MSQKYDFAVDEAWILFRLNGRTPVQTENGAYHCLALLDGGSDFILGTQLVPAGLDEPSALDIKRLLRSATKQRHKAPSKLYIPKGIPLLTISQEATRLGMGVLVVPAKDLSRFTAEATMGFKQYLRQGH
jgi:hypothetical protein